MTQFFTIMADLRTDTFIVTHRLIEALHRTWIIEIVLDKFDKTICQIAVADFVVTIGTIFIELMQIHIIDAGAGVQNSVIKNRAFDMQYSEQFAGFDRYAVKSNIVFRI